MVDWNELTEKEREEYANQDHCTMKHIYVNTDTFDSEKYSMSSVYYDMCIEDYNVDSIFECLSRRQAEVVKLLFLEGMAQKVAAKKLGISRNSVKTHLSRARKKLRLLYPGKQED